MKKKNKERILAGLIIVGFLIVFGATGGMETNTMGLTQWIYFSLIGFALIAVAILIANREGS